MRWKAGIVMICPPCLVGLEDPGHVAASCMWQPVFHGYVAVWSLCDSCASSCRWVFFHPRRDFAQNPEKLSSTAVDEKLRPFQYTSPI